MEFTKVREYILYIAIVIIISVFLISLFVVFNDENYDLNYNTSTTSSDFVAQSSQTLTPVEQGITSSNHMAFTKSFTGLSGGSNTIQVTSNTTLPLGQWNNIIITYNLSEIKLYQNNILVANATSDSGIYYSFCSIYISKSFMTTQHWLGAMDEIRIYNKILSDAEITEIYNSELIANASLPSDGLVLWYPFNEGEGTTVYDKSGNGNDGV